MNLEELVLPLRTESKNFNLGVAGAIAGVTALIGTMAAAVKIGFDWAGELDSIGDVMDVTNTQAAALNFTLHKSGVDTEAFTKSIVIFNKGLVKADGTLDTIGNSLKDWGINVKDANGQLKDQSTLINEVAKKYGTLGTQQEKVNFLTEVFGRSGAELIDFFDVLAKEGGLDAVTEKVKAFGLAIDPARYEDFTRNLEEIKLIGTGLAVTFTEQLMPVLESLLGWVTSFASADPATQLKMLADPLKELFNLTDAFKTGVSEIDWAGLSQQLADGINSIDWSLVGMYIRQGVSNVLMGIYTIVSEIDWGALADATGNALAGLVAGLYGYPDWDALAKDFNNGFATLFGYTSQNAFQDLKNDFLNGFVYIRQGWDAMLNGLKSAWQTASNNIVNGAIAMINNIISLFNQIPNVNLPTIPGVGNSSGGNPSNHPNMRASGGPVIAGQAYQVSEFFRPERFVPGTNGRIDPIQQTQGGMGDDAFIQRFAEAISRSLRSELQKSGRK